MNSHGTGKIKLVWIRGSTVYVEVRKRQSVGRVSERSKRRLDAIAREIDPLQEMADLVAADPEGDPQHFGARHLLAKGCIEAGARLLDEPEMERSGVGDGLDMVIRSEIRVVPGDRGELPRTGRATPV